MLRWLSGRGFDRLVGTITSASGWCPLPAEENQSLSQNGERQEEGARLEETVVLGWEERLRRAGPGVQSEMLASKVLSFGFPVQLATLAPAPCLEGAALGRSVQRCVDSAASLGLCLSLLPLLYLSLGCSSDHLFLDF